ncbi:MULTISPECIES: hypothetical protein [Clostridia]|uniref:hypothetical protein n=1 Tax=Clostridia TaxID=186801 RepID=UPI00067F4EAF|nr:MULTISPECIES: hypothetical protein [Clostridia]
MSYFKEYKEHIEYTFAAFCKVESKYPLKSLKIYIRLWQKKKSNTEQRVGSGSPSYEHGDVFVREKLVPYKIQNILEKLPETIPVLSYPSLYRRCRSSGF